VKPRPTPTRSSRRLLRTPSDTRGDVARQYDRPIDDVSSSDVFGAASLAELVTGFEAAGFRGQMAARPGGRLVCFVCHREFAAGDADLVAMRRTEGASDPGDMVAVLALKCPHCGTKATAVLGFGPESDEDDAEVLRLLN
jgi:hypothetical protein